ncbi:MAG: hybrid sensor histidine kinase/response regulator [Alphaproteobacteria bacterium]|nr:hybrid sensor histidine kinase/response regulator [Alphaproteobacteria bacterium]
MDDLLSEFLTETNESLDVVDVELVRFEKKPTDKAVLDNIFRLVHTVKGTCGFLGLPRLESVAHASENVLGKFRDGELQVSTQAVSLILKSIDAIKSILAELEANEAEPEGNDKELIDQLNEIASGKIVEAAPPVKQPEPVKSETILAATEKKTAPKEAASDTFADGERKIEPVLGRALLPGKVSMEDLEAAFNAAPAPEAGAPPVSESVRDDAVAEAEDHSIEEEPIRSAGKEANQSPDQDAAVKNPGSSIANQSVRVTVDLLEHLMTMVSELVLTRNQLMQIVRDQEDSEFKGPLQRLNLVTTELQEGVMETRMQPIGNAWQKLPRIVRDLSHELGKKIELKTLGADTELDRQVLEMIKDPLTHMIRNSADHGLEQPKKRLAAGKPELGTIKLNAYHEGGHVIIQISDDGAGLNIERIKQKAISSGVATEAELEEMTDQEIGNFIFKAGFSTAEKITSVSGRGVGMDVVRSNIEKIGGTADVRSTAGKGSVFTVKIPLTLAIVLALVVESYGERFAIPQISVIELVRASDTSEHKIEQLKSSPVLRLRDQLLPLVYLSDVLRMKRKNPAGVSEEASGSDTPQTNAGKDDFVVVTQVGEFRFGIVVERVFDTEEIVVKPVAPILRNISVFSGNTILGDGSVIMILDPNGIANMYGNNAADPDEAAAEAVTVSETDKKVSLLVFKAGDDTPKAAPLSLIARLEELDSKCVETSNGRDMIQYRGQLMPLVRMSDSHTLKTEGQQQMLVFADETRTMGLAVDSIIDIVEDVLKIEITSEVTGVMGTAVIAGHATDVIDVSRYLVVAFPDWFEESRKTRIKTPRNVLLIDDSPFFRNMLGPVLGAAGYKVTTAENADQALTLREDGVLFDVIISDIEMPGMNGFELASLIKADVRWQDTPIVAISSHGTPDDFERGRQVGFSDYVIKMDRGALLRSLTETLAVKGAAI